MTTKKYQKLEQWLGPNKKISLRLIEFFFLHWSRRHQIFPEIHPKSSIYALYREQLSKLKKANFDFFCRNHKDIQINQIQTNQAQLNFFQWFFSIGLDGLILKYHTEIKNEIYLKNKQKTKPDSTNFHQEDPWKDVIKEKLCMMFRF